MRAYTKADLDKIIKDHRLWLEGIGGVRADLTGADLRGAYLTSADLTRADLTGADLTATIYENDIPIIINTEYYSIVKCKAFIKIGCKTYTLEEWKAFTDSEIKEMDDKALEFWNKYKDLVLLSIEEVKP